MSDEGRIDGYARALFEVARAEGTLDEVEDELFRFARTYESNESLRDALTDEMVPAAMRQKVVEDLLGDKTTSTTVQLVSMVVGSGRGRELPAIIDKLVVYPQNMRKNLDHLGGLVHSQRVLIALTQKGVAREDAYRLVQKNAMKAWRGEDDFLSLLAADQDVRKHLSEAELKENFDLGYHLKHVDTIFKRVFGKVS